ncbi:DUF2726 domain-containing protein [Sphingomonas rhizophila]|uniref:DUF2726 domain-containing protein n=1 Tax=Sphingomonas rhizophila TaxID=2071607 RepID=A0A7G9SAD7_9SPHN|nr:DUF2726 domain-containing protein [Sphingomonas rhizophila]QNN64812.1 DUF2726 domain-containing protein [Sphingomonas rhizophila]
MPPEILALIDKPLSLIAVLFVGAMFGIVVEQFTVKQKRKAWRERNSGRSSKGKPGDGKVVAFQPKADPIPDSADQLRTVMAADFTVQPLLNRGEARLFKELDRLVLARHPSWQVMAQVSLGEILRSKSKDAYACINSKRVDLLVVDADCNAVAAIEYQGTGHHLTDAAARDAVKKEALRKAGIGYHEVVAGHTTPGDLRGLVEKLVPSKD